MSVTPIQRRTLYTSRFVGIGRCPVSHGQIVNKDAIACLVFVGDRIALFQAIIEQVVVFVKELLHFILIQQTKSFLVLEFFNHCTRHAQMQPA